MMIENNRLHTLTPCSPWDACCCYSMKQVPISQLLFPFSFHTESLHAFRILGRPVLQLVIKNSGTLKCHSSMAHAISHMRLDNETWSTQLEDTTSKCLFAQFLGTFFHVWIYVIFKKQLSDASTYITNIQREKAYLLFTSYTIIEQ
jgi:hypothetical protein